MKKLLLLGEILVKAQLISHEELQEALKEQKETKQYLGEILIKKGIITADQIGMAIASQLKISFINLNDFPVDKKVVYILPEEIVNKFKVVPLKLEGKDLTVAMVDPLNVFALQKMQQVSGYRINPVLTTSVEMDKFIAQHFGSMKQAESAIREIVIHKEEEKKEEDVSVEVMARAAEGGPVIKLVDSILAGAIEQGASDIHLESHKNDMLIRYRIDGVLYDKMHIPKELQALVLSRVKIMADLDIADRRMPQDGRIGISLANKSFDLRVSTLPAMHGEKIVLRILDKSSIMITLDKLGMEGDYLTKFNSLIMRSYGIILVVGPTGSGKTTTLYSALNKINRPDVNIVTVEDPIEYELEGITQVAVNPKIGVTFARGLRHILRQDPDVIMIGEIRDLETAEIAIQAALTGHLVFSTLHTNDAPSAVVRLIDMGVEPFLISSSLIGVLSQRLVRVACPYCKKIYKTKSSLIKEIKEFVGEDKEIELVEPVGCSKCHNIGYSGRSGIYELMLMSEKIRHMVLERRSSLDISNIARAEGMETLRQNGINKVLRKETTLQEVMRVAFIE